MLLKNLHGPGIDELRTVSQVVNGTDAQFDTTNCRNNPCPAVRRLPVYVPQPIIDIELHSVNAEGLLVGIDLDDDGADDVWAYKMVWTQ